MAVANPLETFIWGRGGEKLTPQQAAREREIANALMGEGVDTSPVGHWLQGAARVAQAGAGAFRERRADRAETAGQESASEAIADLLGGGQGDFPEAPASPSSGSVAGSGETPENWPEIQAGIFEGESGGDYNALFGYSNRPGEKFSDVRLTDMTVDEALSFSDPSGPYGQWVKGQVGRVATPMGAYQVVGSTLREAKNALGLTGNERMTPEMQDRIGQWVLANQGTDAWEGYRGPRPVSSGVQAINDVAPTPDSTDGTNPYADVGVGDATFRRMRAGESQPPLTETEPEGAAPKTDRLPRPQPSPERFGRGDNEQRIASALLQPGSMTGGQAMPMQGGGQAAQRNASSFAPPDAGLPETAAPGTVMRGDDGQIYQYAETTGMPGASGPQGWIRARESVVGPPQNAQMAQAGGIDPNDPSTIPAMAGGTRGTVQPNQNTGGSPGIAQLLTTAQNPWLSESQGGIVNMLLEQQMQQSDPMRQLEMENIRSQIDARGQQDEAPSAFRALDMRARAAGMEPGTEGYQQFMAAGGESQDQTAATQRIGRLTENLMATGDFVDPQQAQNVATGIVDGRLKADRHPTTRALQIVDMATGQIVYGDPTNQDQGQDQSQPQQTGQSDEFGTPYEGAEDAFGVEGAGRGAINLATDAFGLGPAFPETQQAQTDFNLLRENLLNDIASGYDRQPPSWLLREIRSLTPGAGNPFQGAEGAQSQLRAIGRQMQGELESTQEALQRDQSPDNRIKLEMRRDSLMRAMGRIRSGLNAFGGQGDGQGSGQTEGRPGGQLPENMTEGGGAWDSLHGERGVDPTGPPEGFPEPELWEHMSPEDRALWR